VVTNPLQCEFAGLKLDNPFLLASAPPTRDSAMLDRAFQAGWAGAVIKTIPSDAMMQRGLTQEPRPLLAHFKRGAQRIGMGNLSITGQWGLVDWAAALPALKARHPSKMVLGSFGAEVVRETWQTMARALVAAGVDGIELALSCTHATLGREVPLIVGEDPELAAQVVGWVTEVVPPTIPVIPKLPASVRDWRGVLEACCEAGAAGVTTINTLSSLMGVDLDTMQPLPNVQGVGTYCGYSGPGIKPIALAAVSRVHKVGLLPVSATGGISNWQDAAEFILLGACCVQVCSAVMWSGYGIIDKMLAGLTGYLQEKGGASVQSLVGRANDRVIDSVFRLEPDFSLVARITDRCTNCGRCVIACQDGAHQAIRPAATPEGAPHVDLEACVGCALCAQVCPVDAIEFGPRARWLA